MKHFKIIERGSQKLILRGPPILLQTDDENLLRFLIVMSLFMVGILMIIFGGWAGLLLALLALFIGSSRIKSWIFDKESDTLIIGSYILHRLEMIRSIEVLPVDTLNSNQDYLTLLLKDGSNIFLIRSGKRDDLREVGQKVAGFLGVEFRVASSIKSSNPVPKAPLEFQSQSYFAYSKSLRFLLAGSALFFLIVGAFAANNLPNFKAWDIFQWILIPGLGSFIVWTGCLVMLSKVYISPEGAHFTFYPLRINFNWSEVRYFKVSVHEHGWSCCFRLNSGKRISIPASGISEPNLEAIRTRLQERASFEEI